MLHTLVSPNAERWGRFGFAIARLLDMDGDGLDDLVVGAFWENPNDDFFPAGRCYVYSAASSAEHYELASPNELPTGDNFGLAVAGLNDVDGDGRGDFVVSTTIESGGRAYVYSGAVIAR